MVYLFWKKLFFYSDYFIVFFIFNNYYMVKNYIIFLIGILPIIYFFLNRKKENSKNDIEIHFNYLKEIKEVFKSEKIKEVIYILGNSGGDFRENLQSAGSGNRRLSQVGLQPKHRRCLLPHGFSSGEGPV